MELALRPVLEPRSDLVPSTLVLAKSALLVPSSRCRSISPVMKTQPKKTHAERGCSSTKKSTGVTVRPMLGHSSPLTSRGSSPSQALSLVPALPPISREWQRALAPDSPHYAGGIPCNEGPPGNSGVAHSERGKNAPRAGYPNGGFVKGKTDIKTAAASSVTSIPLTGLPAVPIPGTMPREVGISSPVPGR